MTHTTLSIHSGKYTVLIDTADYIHVSPYGWCLSNDGYVVANITNRLVLLSRFILDAPPDAIVSYLNHDKLDHRRSNLFITDRSHSQQRQISQRIGSSNYRGVQYHKATGRWKALITFHQKGIHIGYFDDEIDAARAYDRAALEHYGEHAWLNFPINGTAFSNDLNRRGRPRTSQYRGVGLNMDSGRWRVSIYVNRHRIHLGYFGTEIEAAQAYDRAALEYYGSDALLNFPLVNS